MNIETPHIPSGVSTEDALKILGAIGGVEKHDDERELFYKASCDDFEVGFYHSDGKVTAAWYNDPKGRDSEEGLNQNRELLIIKSTLDGFSSIALAATFGIGVLFSIIPLFIFQGGLTIGSKKLTYFFDQTTIDVLSSIGGILIIGIAINILGLGDVNLENLLPSLFLSIILAKANQYWAKRKDQFTLFNKK